MQPLWLVEGVKRSLYLARAVYCRLLVICLLQRSPQWRYTERRVGHLVISSGSIKLPAHHEVGDGVSPQNIGKPSHIDAAVCPRKFY
jgi:hypothetical protein